MQTTDLVSILSAIAGIVGSGLLTVFGDSVDAVAPGWGKKTVGVLTAISYAAAIIVYVLKNRSTPPGLHTVLTTDVRPTADSTLTTHADPAVDAIAKAAVTKGPQA